MIGRLGARSPLDGDLTRRLAKEDSGPRAHP